MQYDNSKDNTIELLSIIGMIASIVSLLQTFVFFVPHWVTYISWGIYLLGFIGYLLLFKVKSRSVPLLIASSVLLLFQQAYFLAGGLFMGLSIALLVFTIITVVLLYMQDLIPYIKWAEKDRAYDPAKE